MQPGVPTHPWNRAPASPGWRAAGAPHTDDAPAARPKEQPAHDETTGPPSLEALEHRFAAAGFKTRYYTPEVHKAAFAHPAYVHEIVEAARK